MKSFISKCDTNQIRKKLKLPPKERLASVLKVHILIVCRNRDLLCVSVIENMLSFQYVISAKHKRHISTQKCYFSQNVKNGDTAFCDETLHLRNG